MRTLVLPGAPQCFAFFYGGRGACGGTQQTDKYVQVTVLLGSITLPTPVVESVAPHPRYGSVAPVTAISSLKHML